MTIYKTPWYQTKLYYTTPESYLIDIINCKNRCFEYLRLKSFEERAKRVDEIYGTHYLETYNVATYFYEEHFNELLQINCKDIPAIAKLDVENDKFVFTVNPYLSEDPRQMIVEQFSKFIDLLHNNKQKDYTNPLLKQIEQSLVNKLDGRYSTGSYQKALMNKFRRMLLNKGVIKTIDEEISVLTVKEAMSELSVIEPIKRAYNAHKSAKHYAFWLNEIPLI